MPTRAEILRHLWHWKQALTGPLVTIILLLYEQWAGKSPTWGWFAAIIASGLAWQFYSELKKSQSKSEELERHLADAPLLKVLPNGFYVDVRPLVEQVGPVIRQVDQLSCIHVKFKNNPERSTERSIGKNILAELNYFDDADHLLCTVLGRWGDTPQPPYLLPGQSPAQVLAMVDFGIGQERELDIAFKYQNEADCFAMSNDTYAYRDWRHPKQKLSRENVRVRVRLRGVGVDSSWDFWFHNPKSGALQKIRQQQVGLPAPQ